MKHECGHEGCDLCGAHKHGYIHLHQHGKLLVCSPCIARAVQATYDVITRFGPPE